jgi:hypothetical protein
MLMIRCPQCGSLDINRANHNVTAHENIYVEEYVDHVIDGGNERRVVEYYIRTDDTIPPYIEEHDSNDLEFSCNACNHHFEGLTTDEDMLRYAQDSGLVVWNYERAKDNPKNISGDL